MSLQNEVDAYLHERGIDDTLAVFIPAYAEYKDQRVRRLSSFPLRHWLTPPFFLQEYMRWLKNIKSFVDA
jgi:complement component 1 Q subcomponent-binding protein, mitochondrial